MTLLLQNWDYFPQIASKTHGTELAIQFFEADISWPWRNYENSIFTSDYCTYVYTSSTFANADENFNSLSAKHY